MKKQNVLPMNWIFYCKVCSIAVQLSGLFGPHSHFHFPTKVLPTWQELCLQVILYPPTVLVVDSVVIMG